MINRAIRLSYNSSVIIHFSTFRAINVTFSPKIQLSTFAFVNSADKWNLISVDLRNRTFLSGQSELAFVFVLLCTQRFRDTFTVRAVGRKSGSDETLCRIRFVVSLLPRARDDVSSFMQIFLLAQMGSPM